METFISKPKTSRNSYSVGYIHNGQLLYLSNSPLHTIEAAVERGFEDLFDTTGKYEYKDGNIIKLMSWYLHEPNNPDITHHSEIIATFPFQPSYADVQQYYPELLL